MLFDRKCSMAQLMDARKIIVTEVTHRIKMMESAVQAPGCLSTVGHFRKDIYGLTLVVHREEESNEDFGYYTIRLEGTRSNLIRVERMPAGSDLPIELVEPIVDNVIHRLGYDIFQQLFESTLEKEVRAAVHKDDLDGLKIIHPGLGLYKTPTGFVYTCTTADNEIVNSLSVDSPVMLGVVGGMKLNRIAFNLMKDREYPNMAWNITASERRAPRIEYAGSFIAETIVNVIMSDLVTLFIMGEFRTELLTKEVVIVKASC